VEIYSVVSILQAIMEISDIGDTRAVAYNSMAFGDARDSVTCILVIEIIHEVSSAVKSLVTIITDKEFCSATLNFFISFMHSCFIFLED
jgi:hypothetical protein